MRCVSLSLFNISSSCCNWLCIPRISGDRGVRVVVVVPSPPGEDPIPELLLLELLLDGLLCGSNWAVLLVGEPDTLVVVLLIDMVVWTPSVLPIKCAYE